MDVQVFTKRFLHQCYLFDCLRGAQPFCNVDHEWVALADEDHPHSIFFVDGVSRQHQDLLSFKILTVKALNQACGVPFIGAEVLTQPPWLLEEFNMNREERETARSWLFMSESDIPGDPWVATGQRRVYGIECTMYVMYETPPFGRFILSRYRSPLHEDSVYWLNFNERNVGSWKILELLNRIVDMIKPVNNDDNRRYNAGISENLAQNRDDNLVNQLSGNVLISRLHQISKRKTST
ncbi:hypothetical protein YC2023_082715 [Brassica napus]